MMAELESSSSIMEIMKGLGWGSGFKLPMANDENKELEKLLEMKQSKLLTVTNELYETRIIVENLSSNFKHLDSKMQHARDVQNAGRAQMEKEKHFYALAQRDRAKYKADVKAMEKRIRAVQARNETVAGNINRRKAILGELVDTINFDKKAIVAYENKFKDEDAYLKLIEEFAETDREKYDQCKKEYGQLGEKICISRTVLDQTISETEILEGEFEELAKRFRSLHAERNAFVRNWKDTLKALENRDKEIVDMRYEYQLASMDVKKANCLLSKQESFHENIKNQSKAHILELAQIDRTMNSFNMRKKEEEASEEELSNAIKDLAQNILQVEKEMRAVSKQFRRVSSQSDQWQGKIEKAMNELEALKSQYDVYSMESMTSIEQANQLANFLDNEEAKTEALLKDLMKFTQFKSERERQAKYITDELTLCESIEKNLCSSIMTIKKTGLEYSDKMLKVKSVVHGYDMQILGLAQKIISLENPKAFYSTEEYGEIVEKITHLKETYRELQATGSMLKSQASHCENILTVCQKEITKEIRQNRHFEEYVEKLHLEISRISKDEEDKITMIKDMGVSNSLLNVQLNKMLQSIKIYEVRMLNMEQDRTLLHAVVKDRRKEIEMYTTLLTNKRRGIREDTSKLRGTLHEVSNECEIRKRKYEAIMLQMWSRSGDAEGDGGKDQAGGRSEAYYIVKIAQEKEYYRQEGDKWDARVKEAEKVVEGLQNTLALMIGSNGAFKESLKPITLNTPEGQQIEELKMKELESAHILKQKKDQRRDWLIQLKEKQSLLDQVLAEKGNMEHAVMEKEYELRNLVGEVNGQKEKIQRATFQANKLVKELSKLDWLNVELLQTDLRLRATKEKYEFAVSTLERLLAIYPYLLEDTLDFLDEKEMISLKTRIFKKMICPSLVSSPQQSGQTTPAGSARNSAIIETVPGVRRKTVKASVDFVVAKETKQSFFQPILQSQRSMHKSIVFSTLTATPHVQKVLTNITRGMEEVKRKRTLRSFAQSQKSLSDDKSSESQENAMFEREKSKSNAQSQASL